MSRSFCSVLAVVCCFAVAGCDGDTPSDGGPGMDGGGGGGVCGDGVVDPGEECDDGNATAFDGCEPGTCTFTCGEDGACNDGLVCNGAEVCVDHVCTLGTPPIDGRACTQDGGADGVCRTGTCVAAGCGNSVVDMGEECDDGNDIDGDGCDVDCTLSCTEDLHCADGDICNGDETCDVPTNACISGTPLDCVDGIACTDDLCNPIEGCENPLIDGDMDGHAPTTLGACGDDCDDTRADVYTGAEELCDGVDNNCNTDIDEVAPTWYIDCDADGFAATTDSSRTGCTEPPSSATGCSGQWTNTRPVDTASTDCNDVDPDVFPGQTMYFTTAISGMPGNYDYNCDGLESRQYGCGPSSGGCGPRCSGGYQPYDSSTNPNGCRWACSTFCFLSTPACGVSATYQSCAMLSFCLSTRPSSRTQGCR